MKKKKKKILQEIIWSIFCVKTFWDCSC